MKPSPLDISIPGIIRLHILAATITPPVNHKRVSIVFFLIVLKKNTVDAPRAVTHQVKTVARNAHKIGSIFSKNKIISCIK
jgi:hypothetical protein